MNFPERRRRTRVLTLKNAAVVAVALAVAFALLSIWSAVRPAHSGASLFDSRASSDSPAPRDPYPVVQEGPVPDYPDAQLIVHDAPPVPPSPPSVVPQKTIEPREPQLGKGQRVTITGGSEGVRLKVETAPAPRSQ